VAIGTLGVLEYFITVLGGIAHCGFISGLPTIPWSVVTDNGSHKGSHGLGGIFSGGLSTKDRLKLLLIPLDAVELCDNLLQIVAGSHVAASPGGQGLGGQRLGTAIPVVFCVIADVPEGGRITSQGSFESTHRGGPSIG